MNWRSLIAVLGFCIVPAGCGKDVPVEPGATNEGEAMQIEVSSAAFKQGGDIPQKYTGFGENISPPLQLESLPKRTKSIAIICDDPDAPVGTFVHWVIYNLPAETTEIASGVKKGSEPKNGVKQGQNSFGNVGYDGPKPPPGKSHRYFFKAYALDSELRLGPGAGKAELLEAMKGHILAKGDLMGKFQRPE